MKPALRAIRGRPVLVFWALAALIHLVAHDAVWLAQVGPGAGLARALREAGHGYWGAVSLAIVVVAAGAALLVIVRVWSLGRRARAVRAPAPPAPMAGYRRRLLAAWVRLAALVLVAFTLQENAEHFIAHGHLLGGDAIAGPEYPLTIPVITAIAGVAAAIAAAVRTVERRLLDGIAAALGATTDRAPRVIDRAPLSATARRLASLVSTDAERAPPLRAGTTWGTRASA